MHRDISYISHDQPARRFGESYLAMVDLGPFGFDNMYEQVWLRPVSEGSYELTCLPFRAYGLSLGDIVELHDGRFVEKVTKRSGHRVFRVFFTEPRPSATGRDTRIDLRTAITSGAFLSEWSGDRHVAVDVPADCDPTQLFNAVQEEIDNGSAFWEWSDAEPFRFPFPAPGTVG
ncbi:DUF4265 domain-containing protein [Streptomyces triculaminicus]|uniref:DUF4265 domain-containing protein n=1 Tax=Streptomyces triculaminicus TaxID=2816232 RepID=UPI0033C8F5BC